MGRKTQYPNKFYSMYEPITETGCWVWLGYSDKNGYGKITLGGRGPYVRAHRYSYELHKGTIPEGKIVRHLCNNPSCVNPDHLKIGDHYDNAADRETSGRTAKGSKSGRFDHNVYILQKDDEVFIGTQSKFIKEAGITSSQFCTVRAGIRKSMKGWRFTNAC